MGIKGNRNLEICSNLPLLRAEDVENYKDSGEAGTEEVPFQGDTGVIGTSYGLGPRGKGP